MDINTLIWARAIERALVLVCAGSCLVMGALLFLRGIVVEQEASIKGMNWEVRLHKVGPGVFFALFGAAILGLLATRPLSISDHIVSELGGEADNATSQASKPHQGSPAPMQAAASSSSAPQEKSVPVPSGSKTQFSPKVIVRGTERSLNISYGERDDTLALRRIARAINTVLELQPSARVELSEAQQDDLKRAEEILADERNKIIISNFRSREQLDVWKRTGGKMSNAASLSDKKSMEEIAPWMADITAEPAGSSSHH